MSRRRPARRSRSAAGGRRLAGSGSGPAGRPPRAGAGDRTGAAGADGPDGRPVMTAPCSEWRRSRRHLAGQHRPGSACTTSTGTQHARRWPGPTDLECGSVGGARRRARGQRGSNGHPGGGWRDRAGHPVSRSIAPRAGCRSSGHNPSDRPCMGAPAVVQVVDHRLLHDLAGVHHDHAISQPAMMPRSWVIQHDGEVQLPLEPPDEVEQLVLGADVEGRRGLIRDQQFRTGMPVRPRA